MKKLFLKKVHVVFLAAAFLMMPVLVSQAGAAMVTYDVTFSANDFQSAFGATPPVDPVVGSFRITFDPSQSYPLTGTTSGIALLNTPSLNINLGSALSFAYGVSPCNADELVVGGISDGRSNIVYSPATSDFWLFIDNFTSGSPSFVQLGYCQANLAGQYYYTVNGTGSVTVTPVSPAPIPSALLLMGSGLLLGWRRFRKN